MGPKQTRKENGQRKKCPAKKKRPNPVKSRKTWDPGKRGENVPTVLGFWLVPRVDYPKAMANRLGTNQPPGPKSPKIWLSLKSPKTNEGGKRNPTKGKNQVKGEKKNGFAAKPKKKKKRKKTPPKKKECFFFKKKKPTPNLLEPLRTEPKVKGGVAGPFH